MMKLFPLLLVSALLMPPVLAQDSAGPNLLKNGNFSQFSETRVKDWLWPQTPRKALGENEQFVQMGVRTDASGDPHLFIETTEPIEAHVWVQQEVDCFGGTTYTLNVNVAGDLEDSGHSSYDVGLYFLNENGNWIGYERSPSPNVFSPDWEQVTVSAIAPDDAVKIGVRLGVRTKSRVAAKFSDAVLSEAP